MAATATYTAEYTFPADLTNQVYVKVRQVQRNGVALEWSSASSQSSSVWIDKNAPTCTINGVFTDASATLNAINNLGFVTTGTVYLLYTISDDGSGISTATYAYNNGSASTLTGSPMEITLPQNTTSATILNIFAADNASNSASDRIQFYVDTVAPTAPSATTLTVNSSRIVGMAVPHETVQNFLYTEYSLVNADTESEVANLKTDFQAPVMTYAFDQDYAYQIKARVRYAKKSGVVSDWTPYSNSVWIDATVPVIRVAPITGIDGNNYCKASPLAITASATDAHSGIASLVISVDGATATALDNGSATNVALGSDSLNKSITITATDNNGNYISWSREFVFDSTPPTGLTSGKITSSFGRTITWTVDLSSATDATSGLAGFEVRAADSGWGDSSYLYRGQEAIFIQRPSTNASSTLFFALYDRAGNYATAVSSTAASYPPALVSSASISYIPEVNAVQAAWDAVNTDSQGSATDAIAGYRYFCTYKLSDGSYTSSSATVYTTLTNTAFVPIPLANILTTGDNSLKLYVRAFDVWGASSTAWAVSDIMTTRKVVGADLSGNCFQFKAIAVQGDGTKTVNFSNTGETIDEDLNLIIDGLFDNA
jgi:hypothetical protein